MTPTQDTGGTSNEPTPGSQDTGGNGQDNANKGSVDLQAAVDAAVASVRKSLQAGFAKKAAEFTGRIATLEHELAAAKGGQKPDEAAFKAKVEDALKPHLDEKKALGSRIEALTGRVSRAALVTAAGGKAVEGAEEFVADALAKFVRLGETGEPEVIDADGMPRFGKGGGPMKVAELVEGFLAEKPFLAKSATKSGLGFGGAKSAAGTPDAKHAELDAQIAEADKAGNAARGIELRMEKARLVKSGQ